MRILLIDIDTLRPDHLGCYEYHRPTSPHIDALAEGGVRFDQVYASDVPCLPSRTALCTGRFGTRTGVVGHGGRAAELDLAPEGGDRQFMTRLARQTWAARFYWAGYRTATFSSFPLRHSAPWWTIGFQEVVNAAHGFGIERADQVVPDVTAWLDRHGRGDDWLCHVHLWDPHTPYNAPDEYGNPFEGQPIPAWYTEDVRAAHWELPGPHSAQEPWGFRPDEWGPPPPRHPWNLSDMHAVTRMFDGYDVGVRYADHHVGALTNHLADLGVLDDTMVVVTSDHGEGFGELGVYADHQAADEATAHIPFIVKAPGLTPRVDRALHYHIDLYATLAELAGVPVPRPGTWDAAPFTEALRAGRDEGREFLVTTQGAWTCQRGVRVGEHLYLRTLHDGYHSWPQEMLFDLAADPHEQHDLAPHEPALLARTNALLDEWLAAQLPHARDDVDPLAVVMAEGGPYHVRGHLPAYLDRLRATGRSQWADHFATR
ncbi:MAG: sulfatase-like hydrolase/transferase [Actinomycetota bacterium]|nr:sulfatase-like hydrolase/transferase [Actinomycetota bacterium]